MKIKREIVAQGADQEAMRQKLEETAATHAMGPANSSNEHGAIYINAKYDLRIERDPGTWGQYRVMLTHKLQPKTSLWSKLTGR